MYDTSMMAVHYNPPPFAIQKMKEQLHTDLVNPAQHSSMDTRTEVSPKTTVSPDNVVEVSPEKQSTNSSSSSEASTAESI